LHCQAERTDGLTSKGRRVEASEESTVIVGRVSGPVNAAIQIN
jgi:hypothetical protein